MIKKSLTLALTSICGLSLAACGGPNNTADNNSPSDTWSIFVYMCGSDLESEHGLASLDLRELLSLPNSDNVNVYVQTGGSATWDMNQVPNDKIGRYKIENGNLVELEVLDNASMGSSETLKSFMDWGKDNYSSSKDMLVMWDHGNGIYGLCTDDNYYDGMNHDNLTLQELKSVMDSRDYNYEVIGFDACLMSNIETLNVVKDDAKYIIASEETEPGGGWAYDKFVGDIINNPSITGYEVGKSICDTYYKHCEENEVESMTTLSVMDTGKLYKVNNALNDYMTYINGFVSNVEEYGKFVRGVGKSETYGGKSIQEEGFYNLFDMVDIANNVNNVPSEKKDALINAVSEAVVYKISGSGRKQSNGISMFYPYVSTSGVDNAINTYGSIADSNNYKVLFDSVKNENSQNEVADGAKSDIVKSIFLDDNGHYNLQLSEDKVNLVDNILLNIYIPTNNENAIIWLGFDQQVSVDYDTGYAIENFSGYLPKLNGEFISFYIYDSGDDYILYNVPIKLNGEKTTLKLMWKSDDSGNGSYTILGVRNDELNEKEITALKPGDKIVPIYNVINLENMDGVNSEGKEITITGHDVVEDVNVGSDTDYYVTFSVKDIYGNDIESEYLHIEFAGDN